MSMTPRKILVPVDGSDNSNRAVDLVASYAASGLVGEVHLLNVQPSVSGDVSAFVGKRALQGYHHDEGMKVLTPVQKRLASTSLKTVLHIGVGDPAEIIVEFCEELGCDNIVMGTRGLGGAVGLLLGSVSTDVLEKTNVPVTLVK
ncbi:MAG: universal stress protein [Pseudomonadota bacterium]|jgi:nucleotide-binding universal stress UspA family protein